MSFIKKFIVKGGPSSPSKCMPNPDIQPIGSFLREKFSRGINYNMKIVIRGDRNVGKSALFTRLKGEPFKEDYVPSTEIQVASIHWNERRQNDVVKVEVWDVVDKGKPRPPTKGLKFRNSDTQNSLEPCLDASFLNVYKGADGVIIVMDMTKSWTFDYVRRELPRVPVNLPILILSTHRDMGHHRTVTEDEVRSYLEEEAAGRANFNPGHPVQSEPPRRLVPVQYCEASMRNGFGLVYVHRFFSVPFFCLKRSVLLQQLRQTEAELRRTVDELGAPEGPLATTQLAYDTYVRIQRAKASPHQSSQNAEQLSDSRPQSSVRSTTSPHQVQSVDGTTTVGTSTINTREVYDASAMRPSGGFSESDDNDEHDFVSIPLATGVASKQPSGAQRPTNPKVLSFQDDLDPDDLLSIRLGKHCLSTSQRTADTESWENVTLSRTSDSSSHEEEEEEATHETVSPIESPPKLNAVSNALQNTSNFRRVQRSASPESPYYAQRVESPGPEFSSLSQQLGHQSLVVDKPISPDAHQVQSSVMNENSIDDTLVQSVFNSMEDEDALERFLADQ